MSSTLTETPIIVEEIARLIFEREQENLIKGIGFAPRTKVRREYWNLLKPEDRDDYYEDAKAIVAATIKSAALADALTHQFIDLKLDVSVRVLADAADELLIPEIIDAKTPADQDAAQGTA